MARCAICPGVYRCLPPHGRQVDILFIGEAPGKREEKSGVIFTGPTGEEVDGHYLPLAGLRRQEVCFANVISCLPNTVGHKLASTRNADLELLECCAETNLAPFIEAHQPTLLVPLGGFATRFVCPGLDLEYQHGFPTESRWGIPAFPMFHPALGMHNPKEMLKIRQDWRALGLYLSGEFTRAEDPYPSPDYAVATMDDIDAIDPDAVTGCDTEFHSRVVPHCLTYSQSPGTGRLISALSVDLLSAFSRRMSGGTGPILFHNWLADAPITARMGWDVPMSRLVDTLVYVTHLGGIVPGGLKALAWRELGMSMQAFEDLVSPYTRELVLDYYRRAQDITWERPEKDVVFDAAKQVYKLYQPQSLNTKLKRFFTDYRKHPERDIFTAWENWEEHQQDLQAALGPYPHMSIEHVPEAKKIYYACRDADALVRLWPKIKQMRSRVRKLDPDFWRTA